MPLPPPSPALTPFERTARALLRQRPRAAACALGLALAGCGGGAELLLIPLFQYGFSGSIGTAPQTVAVQANFQPDQPTQNQGRFEFVNINFDDVQVRYAGSWNGCELQLALDPVAVQPQPLPAAAATSYRGRFAGNDRIELTPTGAADPATLVLLRNPTPQGAPPVGISGC